MSHLHYFDYPGFGERSKKALNYSQAVRIDNRIEISGQGNFEQEHYARIVLTVYRRLGSLHG
jgi:enamine deaminase RidA (YjgF/YER057c/UK114 family)